MLSTCNASAQGMKTLRPALDKYRLVDRERVQKYPTTLVITLTITSPNPSFDLSSHSASAPTQQPRQDQYTSWHSEPTGRGTWGLLLSCTITMGICVWSAVHLNVPGKDPPDERKYKYPFRWERCLQRKKWKRWNHKLRRVRWTLMGLLAPELVVYCAWIQWSGARELSRRIANAKHSPKHPWTLSHSFFAGMGGFAIDTSDLALENDLLYLTTAGAQRIVELGYNLPDLHEEAITDKSKADSLGKILVCLQAGYMVFQVVGRLINHLPVTLLEVNTLGHVLCALAMYAFWFHKPLGVCDPIILTEDWAKQLLFLWSMKDGPKRTMRDFSSSMDITEDYRELDLFMLFAHPERRQHVESNFLAFYGRRRRSSLGAGDQADSKLDLSFEARAVEMDEPEASLHVSRSSGNAKLAPAHDERTVQQVLPEDISCLTGRQVLFYEHSDLSTALKDEDIIQQLRNSNLWKGVTHVYHCDTSDQFELWWQTWSARFAPIIDFGGSATAFKPSSPFKPGGITGFLANHVFLDSAGLRRWELAHLGLERDPDVTLFETHPYKVGEREALETGLVTRRVGNWPSAETGLISRTNTPAWIMAFVTALYGALHALCWNSHFPSFAEKILWRISACIIAGGPATVTALYYGWDFVEHGMVVGTLWEIWENAGLGTALLCAVMYASGRLYILIEAFISLRSLPDAAYQTPNWTPWLPHL